MKKIKILTILILTLLITHWVHAAGPPTIIYKTTTNYNNLVPIGLSEDKSEIVSFSSPLGIYYKGQLAYPTELNQGYLLDNRGVYPNSAFLNTTYEEYSQFNDNELSLPELFDMIIDDNPFLEMYNCGNRYIFQDEVEELNEIINQNRLSNDCESLINQPEPNPEPSPNPTPKPPDPIQINTALSNRIKGQLLLAVEDHGRIFYVNPDDTKKYEITFGNALYLFQRLSLGITNADLEKIPLEGDNWTSAIGNRLKGKLLLQVEDRGRIWYVDMNGKRHEATWNNLMSLFTRLSLGITNDDLDQIENE